jgi:hypothetical protein
VVVENIVGVIVAVKVDVAMAVTADAIVDVTLVLNKACETTLVALV